MTDVECVCRKLVKDIFQIMSAFGYWDNNGNNTDIDETRWNDSAKKTVDDYPRISPHVKQQIEEFIHAYPKDRIALQRILGNFVEPLKEIYNQLHIAETVSTLSELNVVKNTLETFLANSPHFSILSRSLFSKMSDDIEGTCDIVKKIFKDYMLYLDEEIKKKLTSIPPRIQQDRQEFEQIKRIAQKVKIMGEDFHARFIDSLLKEKHRSPLQKLDRFMLDEKQERFVSTDYNKCRINGVAGSGKTVILIHRARRLAMENPDKIVRVFTINRALSEHLSATAKAIMKDVPKNLHIDYFYGFAKSCIEKIGDADKFRLTSGPAEQFGENAEKIESSWRDFFCQKNKKVSLNQPSGKRLVEYIQRYTTDPCRYLREEIIYMQSAYVNNEREERYLKMGRNSRGIRLNLEQKKICLQILAEWIEYQEKGEVRDFEGITDRLAMHLISEIEHKKKEPARSIRSFAELKTLFQESKKLEKQPIKAKSDILYKNFMTDHILIDEYQDFSTLEIKCLLALLSEGGKNKIFMVGDNNQKAMTKHLAGVWNGFVYRKLTQNYRNTRQILETARCLADHYPPESDDTVDIIAPELSPYQGDVPKVFECKKDLHGNRLWSIICQRIEKQTSGQHFKMAVLSENADLLKQLQKLAKENKIRYGVLLYNENVEQWSSQVTDTTHSLLTFGNFKISKGLEFDTVVLADLSKNYLPRKETPQTEIWRDAADAYIAMTRARDELIITYTESPSEFISVLGEKVEIIQDNTTDLL